MITLPSGLKEIGDEAFAGCTGMQGQTIVFPAGVEKIGKMAFLGVDMEQARTAEPEYVEEGDADGD